MKIGVVGGGAAGLFFALFLSYEHPDWLIEIYEKEERVGRKLLATGNGHCNILNDYPDPLCYSTPNVSSVFEKCSVDEIKEALKKQGIYLQKRKEGIYPLTYSAASLLSYILSLLSKRKVVLYTSFRVSDYKETSMGVDVFLDHDTKRHVDFLAIAPGGKSAPRLGSDGSFASVLAKHGYELETYVPALAPIRVKEQGMGLLKGIRHQAQVRILKGKETVFSQDGEILFKEDGLSGIVAFNACSFLTWKGLWDVSSISLDLFPNWSIGDLNQVIEQVEALGGHPLDTLLEKNLAQYVVKRAEREKKGAASLIKNLSFHPSGPYGFNDSQVSHGGVCLKEIDERLHSTREKDLGFLGEALNVDGFCGGYNLTWALATALCLSKTLN